MPRTTIKSQFSAEQKAKFQPRIIARNTFRYKNERGEIVTRLYAGMSKGGPGDDSGHLREHIREGYMHGALIWAALKWAGVRSPELYWQMKLRDQAKRILKRYLYRKLGLVS